MNAACRYLPTVARSRQVCINWVVEALLVAIYLTEKKDVYIHIRLTWSPEANLPPGACPADTFGRPYPAEPSATFYIAESVRAGE
jgi:hypothetical protein